MFFVLKLFAYNLFFFFSSRRRHTRFSRDWSSDVCSSDLKGRQDAQKSKLFGKLAREITVAAKLGQPDPSMNARLRAAIISARQENMSKDSIERAIKKAISGDSENYDEIRYEGYGPGGVAIIVEALTDNRNRAASDIRSFFTKSGGNLG